MSRLPSGIKELANNILFWRIVGITLILVAVLIYGFAATEPIRILAIGIAMLGIFVKGTLFSKPSGILRWILVMFLSVLGGVRIIKVNKWAGLGVQCLAMLLVPSPLFTADQRSSPTIEQG